MLKISNLKVKYGMVQAIHGIDIEVKQGQLVSIVGSNGAGKSTIIRAISGLVPASGGEIHLAGERLDTLPAHEVVKRGVAHVPEGRILFDKLSVYENLELGAFTRTYNKDEFQETLEEVYQLFPILRERARQKAGTFSGGQQQMLAIGRGLMLRPKLLMLDEPSLGLMPALVTQVFEILERIKKRGLTILLVEQNVQESLELADYAYVLQTGKVVLQGEGRDLLKEEMIKKAYLGI